MEDECWVFIFVKCTRFLYLYLFELVFLRKVIYLFFSATVRRTRGDGGLGLGSFAACEMEFVMCGNAYH